MLYLKEIWKLWDYTNPQKIIKILTQVSKSTNVKEYVKDYAKFLLALSEKRIGNLNKSKAIFKSLGFISDWLVLGPLKNESRECMLKEYIPETELHVPDLKRVYQIDGKKIKWVRYPPINSYGYTSLDSVFYPGRKQAAYLATFLYSPSLKKIAFWIGRGGAIKVWLNGNMIFEGREYISPYPDQYSQGTYLRRGWNLVLIKLCVDEGSWGVYFKLKDLSKNKKKKIFISSTLPQKQVIHKGSKRTFKIPSPLLELRHRLKREKKEETYLDLARYLYEFRCEDPKELEAQKLVLKAVKFKPSRENLLLLTELFQDLNQKHETLQKALRISPLDPEILVLIAQIFKYKSKDKEALRFASLALDQDPDYFPATILRAEILERHGFTLLAFKQLRGIIKDIGEVPIVLERAADLAARIGFIQQAKELFNKYLKQRYDDIRIHRELARYFKTQGDEEKAIYHLKQAVELRPEFSYGYLILAQALETSGKVKESLSIYEKAASFFPTRENVHIKFGKALIRAKKLSAGIEKLNYALKLNPHNIELKEYVEEITPERQKKTYKRYVVSPSEFFKFYRTSSKDGETAFYLVDLHVIQVRQNGLSSKFHQIVIQILSRENISRFENFEIYYDPYREVLDVQRARVYRKDGSIENVEERYERSLSSPEYSLYYDRIAYIIPFSDLSPGDVIEVQYIIEDSVSQNPLGEYFADLYFIQGQESRAYVEYIVIAPQNKLLYFNTPSIKGASFKVMLSNGLKIYKFKGREIPRIHSEPNMPGLSEIAAYIHVSTFKSWQELGRWYFRLIQNQIIVDERLRNHVKELTSPLKEKKEKVKVLFNYIVQSTRYVGLLFGIHGYKPYPTNLVYLRGFGDCKDKSLLLIAMLRECGIEGQMVLIRSRRLGWIKTFPPSLAIFDHAIVYIPKLDLWLDGTASYAGTTELPYADQGVLALILSGQNPRLTTTPLLSSSFQRQVREIEIRLKDDGSAIALINEKISGFKASEWRLRSKVDEIKTKIEGIWNKIFPGARVLSQKPLDIKDFERPVEYKAKLLLPNYGIKKEVVLSIPVSTFSRLEPLYASSSKRIYDLDLGPLWEQEETISILLPPYLKVKSLPLPITIDNSFGYFELKISSDKKKLFIKRRLIFQRERISKYEYLSFRDFCIKVDKASKERILLEIKKK